MNLHLRRQTYLITFDIYYSLQFCYYKEIHTSKRSIQEEIPRSVEANFYVNSFYRINWFDDGPSTETFQHFLEKSRENTFFIYPSSYF